ncbi:uncharacterized protein LOC129753490 [Uranotaenia lowii]|uniref:uncharacterized protein LOC129753490 n=1 Tax=Uranotaenia lowii TaxID=190385 RepID=UPI00247934E3|nr:uncharacterized protein LOC129753490 [Uranotaenia lowii]
MDILVKTYQCVGTYSWIAMRDRLHDLKHRRNIRSLSQLFEEYDLIVRELERMGANIPADEKIHALISAVPNDYNHVKEALTVLPIADLCAKPILELKRMFLDAELAFQSRGDFPTRNSAPNSVMKARKAEKIICFGCGEPGHYKNRCPAQRKGRCGKIMVAVEARRSTAGVTSGRKERRIRFVVDSGATQHMDQDEGLLQDVRDLAEPVIIEMAKSGESLRAKKTGQVV